MGEPVTPYKGRDAAPIIKQALELYDQGVEIEQSAITLGVPARTIHRWLASNASDEWKQAQQGRAAADYERARKARDAASATLGDLQATLKEQSVTEPAERNWRLTHAREVLRAADVELDHQKWLLERLIRKLYGQDAPVSTASAVQININLRGEPATKGVVIPNNPVSD
jgi:hypothetical protein